MGSALPLNRSRVVSGVLSSMALAGLEPLSHFIHRGKTEGRRPKESDDFHSLDHAELLRLKAPDSSETMALFLCMRPKDESNPISDPFSKPWRAKA
jgi:hypothetical protein